MATDSQKIIGLAMREGGKNIPEAFNGKGETVEPNCGDILRIYLRINSRQVVEEAGYFVSEKACMPLFASAAAAVQLALGKPALSAYSISKDEIAALLSDDGSLNVEHEHCAIMAELSLKRAVVDYSERSKHA